MGTLFRSERAAFGGVDYFGDKALLHLHGLVDKSLTGIDEKGVGLGHPSLDDRFLQTDDVILFFLRIGALADERQSRARQGQPQNYFLEFNFHFYTILSSLREKTTCDIATRFFDIFTLHLLKGAFQCKREAYEQQKKERRREDSVVRHLSVVHFVLNLLDLAWRYNDSRTRVPEKDRVSR
jgi:hypothetical protein